MTDIGTVQNITRQTEKAILVDVGDREVWVPKSIADIDDEGIIRTPIWFAKKNVIGFFGYRRCMVG